MGTDPRAKLFYGYIQPQEDREKAYESEEDDRVETPWTETHTKRVHGCYGDIYGTDDELGHFIAVEESLHVAEWSEVVDLSQQDLEVAIEWPSLLLAAAREWKLDLTGLRLGWHLVSLYF